MRSASDISLPLDIKFDSREAITDILQQLANDIIPLKH